MSLKQQIDTEKLPKHVAIIMDGNGRWAKQKGKNRIFGHSGGVSAVREIVEAAAELGIKYLTLYTFSTENWNRPQDEVSGLMKLLMKTTRLEVKTLTKNNIRLRAIGDIEGLPKSTYEELKHAMEATSQNTRMELILALNYGSKAEILRATKQIAEAVKSGTVSTSEINEELFSKHLFTTGIPDPELMIRTSGESRLSNFLLWQLAYAEFHFTDTLWPDFDKEEFYKAILSYQKRERRLGMTSEQITATTH